MKFVRISGKDSYVYKFCLETRGDVPAVQDRRNRRHGRGMYKVHSVLRWLADFLLKHPLQGVWTGNVHNSIGNKDCRRSTIM